MYPLIVGYALLRRCDVLEEYERAAAKRRSLTAALFTITTDGGSCCVH
jgi:hypothetical protein